MKCGKCAFEADDLSEHALEAQHFLCICCRRRSLTEFQPQSCPGCIARVRADLADIVEGYALLEPAGVTALTLLGDGTMQRLFHPYEHADVTRHPLARDDERGPAPFRDEWPNDPLPILPALVSWEDFIREDLKLERGPDGPTLTGVVGWLQSNLDSRAGIAQRFHAFDEFASSVARLRSAVQHAAELADDPLEAEAECFDCGGSLIRDYAPPTGPTWPPRRGRSDEGLTDKWRCADCRRVYDQQEYFIGLRIDTEMWVPVPLAAKTAQRSPWTLRSWMRRLMVGSVCKVDDHSVLVWWPDVSDRAFRYVEEEAS